MSTLTVINYCEMYQHANMAVMAVVCEQLQDQAVFSSSCIHLGPKLKPDLEKHVDHTVHMRLLIKAIRMAIVTIVGRAPLAGLGQMKG